MSFNTYRSCLEPFKNDIVALRRRKPPMSYSKIAEYLKEKYQISVRRQTIERFVKVRAKGYKLCDYAWNIEVDINVNQPTTEVPSLPKQTSLEVQETPTQSVAVKPARPIEQPRKKILNMEWSDVYNLTRLSDEEAAERNKRIEEKRKRLNEEKLKKEKQ